jgi:predicted Zn-dependent peptidase
MFFKGAERYPGAKEISEAIEGVGGVLNAGTDKESTVFWVKVPGDKLRLGVDVLCDMLFHPTLDRAELEKERSVVLEELRMYHDSPQDHVFSLFEQTIWPNHPLGRDTAGTEESVRGLTREHLADYLETHYLLGNMVVAVAGQVDHAAEEN